MAWAETRRALLEQAAGLKAELVDLCRAAEREAPSPADAQLLIADIEEEVGRLDEAVLATRAFLRVTDDEALPVLNHLGQLLYRMGRYPQAAACLWATTAREPKAHRWVAYGAALTRLGLRADAIRALACAIESQPDYDEAHLNLGLRTIDEDLNSAGKHFEAALHCDPQCAANYAGASLHALRARHYDEAVRLARTGLSLDASDVPCRTNLAQALEALGRVDEAEAEFREAARRAPADLECQGYLACFLAHHGRNAEARKEFESLLRAWPDQELAYNLYARFLETQPGCSHEAHRVRESQRNAFRQKAALG